MKDAYFYLGYIVDITDETPPWWDWSVSSRKGMVAGGEAPSRPDAERQAKELIRVLVENGRKHS